MGQCLSGEKEPEDPRLLEPMLPLITHPEALYCVHGGRKVECDYQRTTNVLGVGMCGAVKVGINKKSGKKVAIKALRKKELVLRPARISPTLEIECHARACFGVNQFLADQFHLAMLEGVYEDDRFIYMAIEHCEKGDLITHFEDKPFTEDDVRALMRQAFVAIDTMHKKGIIHRDLKPQNMLLTTEGVLKLCDFGSAEQIPPGQTRENMHRDFVSTAYYAAPEVFAKEPHGALCDMWALGITIHVLLTGPPPPLNRKQCPDDPYWQQLQAGQFDSLLPESISKECRDLLSKLLQPDLKLRLTAEEALQHPWFGDSSLSNPKTTNVPLEGSMRLFKSAAVARRLLASLVPLMCLLLEPKRVSSLEKQVAKEYGATITLNQLLSMLQARHDFELHQQLAAKKVKLEVEVLNSGPANHVAGADWIADIQIPMKTVIKNVRICREFEFEYKRPSASQLITGNYITQVAHDSSDSVSEMPLSMPGGSMRGLVSETMVPGDAHLNLQGASLRGTKGTSRNEHTPPIPSNWNGKTSI